MSKTKIYSPTQVTVAAAVFGPFALIYVLRKNFKALGKEGDARKTLLWGGLFNLALVAVLPFLPEKFPSIAIGVPICWVGRLLAEKRQMSKQAIEASEQYTFQGGWHVFGVCMLWLIIYTLVAVAWSVAAEALGLVVISS